jgi:hypothetical protein
MNYMRLLHLDIQGNRITNNGCSLIADGIRRNRYLLFLGLQWNKIDDEGAKFIGKCLTRNTALKAVFLMGNQVTPVGARCILEGSLTFDDTPVSVDIQSLPPRPRGKRVEAEEELERTQFEVDSTVEEAFGKQEQAFREDIKRNALGEEVDDIVYVVEEPSQTLSAQEEVVVEGVPIVAENEAINAGKEELEEGEHGPDKDEKHMRGQGKNQNDNEASGNDGVLVQA